MRIAIRSHQIVSPKHKTVAWFPLMLENPKTACRKLTHVALLRHKLPAGARVLSSHATQPWAGGLRRTALRLSDWNVQGIRDQPAK